jgi:hypothetical protein
MSLVKRLQTIIAATVAIVAVIISVLDLTGAFDSVSWLKSRVPVLTLLVVSAVAAYLISEQFAASRTQADVLSSVMQKVESVSGLEVTVFNGRAEFWRYAARRIRDCKETIDDFTWGPAPASAMSAEDVAAYKVYRQAIQSVSTGRGEHKNKIFREIMSFPDGKRIPRARVLMDPKYPNYHLRYYDYDHSGSPSLLQYYVFDKTEVVISSRWPSSASLNNCFMSFKSPALGVAMSHYFEVAWSQAIVLKDTNTIDNDRLEAISMKIIRDVDANRIGPIRKVLDYWNSHRLARYRMP